MSSVTYSSLSENHQIVNRKIRLKDIANAKKISLEFLQNLGLIDAPRGVVIPYFTALGERYPRARIRTAIKAGDGSFWTTGSEPIIPYGLNRLAGARQEGFIVFVEGESDAWTLWSAGFPALGFPGCSTTKKLDANHLENIARIYISREPDQGRETFLNGIKKRLSEIAYKGEVYILSCAPHKDPSDLYASDIDEFPQKFQSLLDSAQLIVLPKTERTELDFNEPPRPLARELPPAPPYPVDALGPLLAPAALVVQEAIQAPLAIIGNSLLAATALAVQALADVELDGRIFPASDFFLTVGESGERKSAVDAVVLAEHRDIQKIRMKIYARDRERFKIEEKFHQKEITQAIAKGSRDFDVDLSTPPIRPQVPLMLIQEPSWEGLLRLFAEGLPSVGLFSDEAGRFLAGCAMSEENRIKTASGLSELWSGRAITVVRKGEGSSLLTGRRLAIHLMLQPKVSSLLLASEALADQGMLSRFLCARPDTTAGTRRYRSIDPANNPTFQAFYQQIRRLLEMPLPLDEHDCTALCLPRLFLATDAKDGWIKFHDDIEEALGPDGEFAQIRAAANKVPEHALRLAAILALFDDPDALVIDLDHVDRGIRLAIFYVQEAKRLYDAAYVDIEIEQVQTVLEWLPERGGDEVTLVEVYRFGPNAIRTAAVARRMMEILTEHGWTSPLSTRAVFEGIRRREAWSIRKP